MLNVCIFQFVLTFLTKLYNVPMLFFQCLMFSVAFYVGLLTN